MSPHDVGTALMALAPIGAGVALIATFGRDQTNDRDQHDVSDYRPTLAPARQTWPLNNAHQSPAGRRQLRNRTTTDPVLPPAPADPSVHLTLYAEQVVVELMRARYGTTSAVVIADRWLREIGQQARGELVVAR